MISLINSAIEGSFSDTLSQGADMGSNSVICYTFDSENDVYLRHILKVTGDQYYDRISTDAQKLIQLLELTLDE